MATTDKSALFHSGLAGEQAGLYFKIEESLYQARSSYQEIEVVQTTDFGRALLLDREVMTTEWDGFIYPEMLIHPAMMSHPAPQKLAIIGGGDGGAATEACRYNALKQIAVCELDSEVVTAAREFFPKLAAGFDDPRTECIYREGGDWLAEQKEEFDVLAIDGTDPVGPGTLLFEKAFYEQAARALKQEGILVQQIESPLYSLGLSSLGFELRFEEIVARARQVFPKVFVYWSVIPTYFGSLWGFLYAGGETLSTEPILARWKQLAGQTRFYSPEIQAGAFALPPFVKALLS